jgi:hypothetical protein
MYLYIRGAARYRDKIYDQITDASDQIDEHLVRLIIYPDNPAKSHWIHEIWSFLHRIHKLKGSKKYPKVAFIEDALNCGNDIIPNIVATVKDMEPDLTPVDVTEDQILHIFTAYQHWLATELSNHGVVNESDVKEVITNLLQHQET